jgi:hypothetical protein
MGMGRAELSGVLLLVGAAAGCGGQLAAPDGGGGGTGGGDPLPHVYTWIGGTVRVEPVGVAADGVKLAVEQAGTRAVLIFPPATQFVPTNGATVRALYGCDGRLSQVVLETCPQEVDLASTYPRCLSLVLTETFVAGEYVEAGGVRWQITEATAELRLPPSVFEGGPPNEAGVGVGTFTAECRDSEGNALTLDGLFAVPVRVSALLC